MVKTRYQARSSKQLAPNGPLANIMNNSVRHDGGRERVKHPTNQNVTGAMSWHNCIVKQKDACQHIVL